jgi:Flp pilus assembly protein TadG
MAAIRWGPPSHAAARRKGTATVELAVCLPLLVIVALGSIEATNAIFLKQHLTSAAYEGARKATTPGKTVTDATTAAQNVLTQFAITGGAITVTPAVGTATVPSTQVSVTVTAPLSSNTPLGAFIIGKTMTTIGATVVMDHQ